MIGAGEGGASWLCMTIGSVVAARQPGRQQQQAIMLKLVTHTHTHAGRGWEGKGVDGSSFPPVSHQCVSH